MQVAKPGSGLQGLIGTRMDMSGSIAWARYRIRASSLKFIWRCAQLNQNASCATKSVDAFLRFETTCTRFAGRAMVC